MATGKRGGRGVKDRNIGSSAGIRPYKLDLAYATEAAFLAAKSADGENSASAEAGDSFYDSTTKSLKVHNGTQWEEYATAGSVTGDVTLSAAGVATITADAVTSAKLDEGTIQYASVSLANIELAALATTPKTVVAAPAAGKVLEFVSAAVFMDYTADAITGQGDLAFRYTDGAGTIVSDTVASADFLELTADAYRVVQALSADVAGSAAAALVLDATAGDPTTGGTINSTLTVKVAYRVHDFS